MFKFIGVGVVKSFTAQKTKNNKDIGILVCETKEDVPQTLQFKCFYKWIEECQKLREGDVVICEGRIGGRSWEDKVYLDAVLNGFSIIERPAGGIPSTEKDDLPF